MALPAASAEKSSAVGGGPTFLLCFLLPTVPQTLTNRLFGATLTRQKLIRKSFKSELRPLRVNALRFVAGLERSCGISTQAERFSIMTNENDQREIEGLRSEIEQH